jgi:hypothetical protein
VPWPVCVYVRARSWCCRSLTGHRRSVPHLAKTRTTSGGKHWRVPNTETVVCYQRSGSDHSNGRIHTIWSGVPLLDTGYRNGGSDEGPGKYMTSYRSELGGIISGLVVLGTILRSGLINARSIEFIRDNSAAILASKRELTQCIFHRTEGDNGLITTMKYLQHNWCNNTEGAHAWVKGHGDRGDQGSNRGEGLNIEADALCDLIRQEARGPRGARPSCPHWDL